MEPIEHNNTMTDLERVGTAHIACYAAWLYPGDDDVRRTAVESCALVGFDYVELVAATMENATEADTTDEDQPGVDAGTARYMVARSFYNLAYQLTQQGQTPRANVTMAPTEVDDGEDDYGSLA